MNRITYLATTVDGNNPAPVEVRSLSHYLQVFIHPRWCSISSINSMSTNWSYKGHFPSSLEHPNRTPAANSLKLRTPSPLMVQPGYFMSFLSHMLMMVFGYWYKDVILILVLASCRSYLSSVVDTWVWIAVAQKKQGRIQSLNRTPEKPPLPLNFGHLL